MSDKLNELESKLQLAQQRAERYRAGRDTAESLLELKASELYQVNLALQESRDNLQQDILQATYELQASNERLQKALDEKSTFIGSISHEIRTPLNAVVGLSELLLESDMSPDQEQYVRTIFESSATLVKLLNDILHISKIEAGKIELQPHPTNLSAMLDSLSLMFTAEAADRSTQVSAAVDPDVPDSILIDEGRVGQIITNLVSNAIKNTEHGEVSIRASIESIGTNNYQLTIAVNDTGIGIEEHQIQRIFSAYEQFGNLDQGVGLGLAICRQMTDVMNGTLSCTSTPGEGSTFTLSIPVEKAIEAELDDKPDAQGDDFSQLSVLIAEDNEVNQQVLRAQFAQLGLVPMIVGDGEQALSELSKNPFDLVFFDIQMPVKDGEQTITELRAGGMPYSNIFATALTAASFTEKRDHLLALGFNEFISKPVTLNNLREVLSKVASLEVNTKTQSAADNPSATANKSHFSYAFFEQQFGEGAETIFSQIAAVFLEHAYAELAGLKHAAQQGESSKIIRHSHSIKGALASIGDTVISVQLKAIEEDPDHTETASKVAEIESQMYQLKADIEALLQSLSVQ